jgi:hypothetical protein
VRGSERQSVNEAPVEKKTTEKIPFKIVTIPPRPNSRKISGTKASPSEKKYKVPN